MAAAIALAACGAFPASGPSTGAIESEARAKLVYELIEIDRGVVARQASRGSSSLVGRFGGRGNIVRQTIGIGDVVNVAIYEASPEGLFSSGISAIGAGSSGTKLPPQVVDQSGTIMVPYAGRIRVYGRTIGQVTDAIVQRLTGKAVEPQVIVTLGKIGYNTATVLGAVVKSGQVPLNPKGDRILDVLAAAGGVRGETHNTLMRVTRGKRTIDVPLSVIVEDPRENIYVWPGDTIVALVSKQSYSVLGAVSRPGEYDFDRYRMTLAQAVAKAAVDDNRANRRGVFIFRYEPREFVDSVVSGGTDLPGETIPVIYRLAISDPASFHLMQRFIVRDGDVLYLANAPTVDLGKFLGLLSASVATVATPAATVKTLSE